MIRFPKFLVLYILIAAAGLFIHFHSDMLAPVNKPFYEFPNDYQGWHMLSQSYMSQDVLDALRPTDYLERSYISSQQIPVLLYIGYHNGGKGSGPVHSPKHCLPGGGWYKESEKQITVDVPDGKRITLLRAVYKNGTDKEEFFYWYQMKGGRVVTNDYLREFYEVFNSLIYRRRDVALIRISVPDSAHKTAATATAVGFIKTFYPVIKQFLPQ